MTIALIQYTTTEYVSLTLGTGTTTKKVILIAQGQAPGSGTLILSPPAITGATWVPVVTS